jgi:hypothetical protein
MPYNDYINTGGQLMTDQHPLTDEMIQDIDLRYRSAAFWECHGFEDVSVYEQKNIALCMRAAYDKGMEDRLEQVMCWLRDQKDYSGILHYELPTPDCECIECALTQAMRPTLEDNNND